ncbi:MAG: lamin tail domain-containing protein, partial [Planctomycetota bacterium]|jgi:hypothetical protein
MGALPFDHSTSLKTDKIEKAGDIGEDEIWTAAEGPYRITEELTIPSGVTLTIGPGVSVFFEPNTRMVVRGRLDAEGSEYESIRFTRTPGSSGPWGGLQFVDTAADNRIGWAVLEYGETNDGMVGVEDSNLVVEHSTLDHSELRRIRTLDSSLIVRDCEFTDIFGPNEPPSTENMSEHIWGRAGDTGRFIIENNVFGVAKGDNDCVDVDGPLRPNPIPQILNNTFLGSGGDAIELNSDAHIEGNRFYNIIRDEWNTTGGTDVISAGVGKNHVAVRNIFYNTECLAWVQEDGFLTFANNSAVNTLEMVIASGGGRNAGGPGLGLDVDGSIFWGTPESFVGTFSTSPTVDNSLLPFKWHGYGTGNIDADPLFVDDAGDFRLKKDSGAIGAGSWGLDMGAVVPSGAAISGEPHAVTHRTTATLIVGGPGITHYKYSVNNPSGPWSSERAVSLPISLTGLVNGQSYTVYAIGKNSAGVWQSADEPTVSHTWTVDTSHRVLLINEILAHTHGQDPDIIELYYDGPTSINLSGMSMTDDPSDPAKFVFSSSRVSDTTMSPGEYMILFGSLNITTNHLGFALSADGEALYLYDKPNPDGSRDLIDSVEFGPQINNYTIGRIGWGREWRLNRMTFNAANKAQPLGDPDTLKINEWLADGQVLFDDDFVELYNPHPSPVSLSGMYMTDNPVIEPDKHRIPDLSFIAPSGYTVFRVNDGNDPSELDFRLSADGEMIALFDSGLNMIDQVLYGPQTTDISQGRLPDGSNSFEFFDLPTPGVSNPSDPDPFVEDRAVLEGLRITELMYNAPGGSQHDYIELHNISATAIQLGGVRFVDGIEFEFPARLLGPGEYVVVVSDYSAFPPQYPTCPASCVAGVYTGGFSGGGEDIVLSLAWPLEAAVMRFEYSDTWYPTTDGFGHSLHINDATAHPSTWDEAESWHAAFPSPGLP